MSQYSRWPATGGGGSSAGKADKVAGAINGDLAGLDASGNLTDSGIPAAAVLALNTRAGSDTIDGATSLAVLAGATAILASDGVSAWVKVV